MNTNKATVSRTIQQAVIERLALLSLEKQQQVLAFAEEIAKEQPAKSKFRSLFEDALQDVPQKAGDETPVNGSSDIGQLATSETTGARLWEMMQECIKDVPPEDWDEVPTDGGLNHDHYLYGAPKRYNPDGSLISYEKLG